MANEELAKKHACTACHAVDKKVVGPSFKEVAGQVPQGTRRPKPRSSKR
jgi:cytochrome c